MNSWHSWSSNGRWLVFSSKANTAYTQLFLTHIDEHGESTPPVVLDRFTGNDRAANIPEFVALPAESIVKINEQFLDAYSFLRAGMANERTGNYPGAVRIYQRGLAVEPDNVELLNSLGFSLFQQGNSKEAVVVLEKALALDPKHWKAHNNIALASIDLGELEVAEAHFRESLAIKPQPAILNDLGFVLERQGLTEEAAEAYRKAIKLEPGLASAHYNLGSSLARSGKLADAEKHLRTALKADPKSAAAHQELAQVLVRLGREDEARREMEMAKALSPGSST
jgi:Flp pilus assembly protein TadD